MLRLEDVSFGYPDSPLLFQHVSFEVRHSQRLALVGPNGSGKTSLLRLIEDRLSPLAGQVHLAAGVGLGVMAQEHETLDPELSVLETVLRERPMSEQAAQLPAVLPVLWRRRFQTGQSLLAGRAQPPAARVPRPARLQPAVARRADQPPRRRI
jgi:ATPase subunit of ABC transporter with duplicated ATPase domains